MKKLFYYTLILTVLISLGFKSSKTIFKPNPACPCYQMTDADAIAAVDAVGDIPEEGMFREAVDSLFIGLKADSIFTKIKHLVLYPPTMSNINWLMNFKTATLPGTAAIAGNAGVPVPYSTGVRYSTQKNTYAKLGVTGTTYLTEDSETYFWSTGADEAQQTGFSWGSSNSTTQRIAVQLRGTSTIADKFTGYLHTSTDNQGRFRYTNTNTEGIYIITRRSNTDGETYKDGTSQLTNTGADAGSRPTYMFYDGCYNVSNVPTNYTNEYRQLWGCADGLTDLEASNLYNRILEFETKLGRKNLTKKLILDGNSLSVKSESSSVNSEEMFKNCLFESYKDDRNYLAHNVAVGGKSTSELLVDYPTKVRPLYDASRTNYIILWEITNDLFEGATVAQAKLNIQKYVDSAQADGFQVIVCTPILRTYSGNSGGYTETTWNLSLDTMVSYVVSNTFGADIIYECTDTNLIIRRSSYASNTLFNSAVATKRGNSTYFLSDETHLKNVGYYVYGKGLSTILP